MRRLNQLAQETHLTARSALEIWRENPKLCLRSSFGYAVIQKKRQVLAIPPSRQTGPVTAQRGGHAFHLRLVAAVGHGAKTPTTYE
jgi:hypothetical protein